MTTTKKQFEVTVRYVVTSYEYGFDDKSAKNIVLEENNSPLIDSVTVLQVHQIAVDENA
jgi:hypothetical protein